MRMMQTTATARWTGTATSMMQLHVHSAHDGFHHALKLLRCCCDLARTWWPGTYDGGN